MEADVAWAEDILEGGWEAVSSEEGPRAAHPAPATAAATATATVAAAVARPQLAEPLLLL